MPNTPQPGRIAPKQSTGKISGAPSSTGGATSSAQTEQEPSKGAAMNKISQNSAAKGAQNRYQKALNKAHQVGIVPAEPKYRISMFEAVIVMAICLIVDLVIFILGLFLITEPVVIFIDMGFGLLMCAWMAVLHRFSITEHWKRYASLLAAFIGEAIPYIDVCSFWALDAWYIIHTIRAEDKQTHQQLVQTVEAERDEQERQEWIENYEQQQAVQAQEEDEEIEEETEEAETEQEESE